MLPPHLTFGCELDAEALRDLFADSQVIADLQTLSPDSALPAGISLGLRDLSDTRADVVRQLNAAGVPVTAWLLLPQEQGYWFNLDNVAQAMAFYDQFAAWSTAQGLQWAGVGLDIEPDIRAFRQILSGDLSMLPAMVRRALDSGRYSRGKLFYRRLVARIRADGYLVESYHFPVMVDERRAGSTLLQRLLGLVDLNVDREVLMLYSSFMRPAGPGMLWSYAPEAQGIAVGILGGGVDIAAINETPPLTWDEFRRDLCMAHHWSDHIFIFSLEGAVQQGFLAQLRDFDWTQRVPPPWRYYRNVEYARKALRAVLWSSAHPWTIIVGGLAVLMGVTQAWRKRARRKARRRQAER